MPQYTWRAVASEQDESCHQNAASVQVGNFASIPNYLHTALFPAWRARPLLDSEVPALVRYLDSEKFKTVCMVAVEEHSHANAAASPGAARQLELALTRRSFQERRCLRHAALITLGKPSRNFAVELSDRDLIELCRVPENHDDRAGFRQSRFQFHSVAGD